MNSGCLSTKHESRAITMKSMQISFTQETVLPMRSGMRQGRSVTLTSHWVVAVRLHQARLCDRRALSELERGLATRHSFVQYLITSEFTSH